MMRIQFLKAKYMFQHCSLICSPLAMINFSFFTVLYTSTSHSMQHQAHGRNFMSSTAGTSCLEEVEAAFQTSTYVGEIIKLTSGQHSRERTLLFLDFRSDLAILLKTISHLFVEVSGLN